MGTNDLAREPIIAQQATLSELFMLGFGYGIRLTRDELDTTGGATSFSAAAMPNVYARLFNCQKEAFIFRKVTALSINGYGSHFFS
jgi:hypothetical protein